jgi:N-acyl-D-amino-acid deacylase
MDLFRTQLRVMIFRASMELGLLLFGVYILPAQSTPISGYSVPELTAFDGAAQSLMAKYQLPGAALAVMRDGRLVLARGYGYADVTNKIPVQPDTLFRTGQVSRFVTAAAVLQLIQNGQLTLQSKAFQVLSQLQPLPGSQVDSRLQDVTILDLLTSEGGWDRFSTGYDPMADVVHIAEVMGSPSPATCDVIIRYMLGRPLDFDPGTKSVDSNFGFCVLGSVIEQVTGQTYGAYVTNGVLSPLSDNLTALGQSLASGRLPGEALYYDYPGAPLAESVFSTGLVPAPYGSFFMEAGEANNGWVSNTIEMLRFLASINGTLAPSILQSPPSGFVYYVPPVGYGWGWIGEGAISGSMAYLRLNDRDSWCLLANSLPQQSAAFFTDADTVFLAAESAVTTWPENDLFAMLPPPGQALDIDQQIVNVSYQPGSTIPALPSVLITSTGPVTHISAVPADPWISVQLSSSTTPAVLQLTLMPQGLSAGFYNTTVTIIGAASASSRSVTIRLAVYTDPLQLIPISGMDVPVFEGLDQNIRQLMQQYSIPGLALGITKGGKLVFAHGYGFADLESQTPVNPTTLFRLASVSKPLTASAADKLVELGKLAYDSKAFNVLSMLQPLPGNTEDPRVNEITIWELEEHYSGWADAIGGNRYGDIVPAANAEGLPLPGTFAGLIQYELGKPLDLDPGMAYYYCNFCYGVLAQAVQQSSGIDYEAFVRQNVLAVAGLSQTRICGTLKSERFPNEVTYYLPPGTPLAPRGYADLPPLVPQQYGGEVGCDWGTGAAAGGWVSNTVELLRLVASVTLGQSPTLFTNPPRSGWAFSGLPIGLGWVWEQDGGVPGTSTILSILDDVAWCILTNTSYNSDTFGSALDQAVKTAVQQTTTWPSGDLFPQYLLPQITGVTNAASFSSTIASGAWVTIFGTFLASQTRGWTSTDFSGDQLPTALSGTSVTINGKPAYVEYISGGQLNVLAPDDSTLGPVQVQVTTAAGASSSFVATKAQFSPAFFEIGGDFVAALHADNTLVSPSSPATPGETIVLFGTGFGPTNPPLNSSQLVTQAAPLANSVTITIGNQPANVVYAGLTASGLDQFNVVVPSGLPTGDATLTAMIGGAGTQAGILLSVKE